MYTQEDINFYPLRIDIFQTFLLLSDMHLKTILLSASQQFSYQGIVFRCLFFFFNCIHFKTMNIFFLLDGDSLLLIDGKK